MHILDTIAHETVWGGNRLSADNNSGCHKIGHLYSLVSNGEFETKILNGPYKGKLFKLYFNENKYKWGLSEYSSFPYIISIVDASDDLSIQVHPDDKIAKELENIDTGKNESWFFINEPYNGKIFNGCKAQSVQDIKKCIEQNDYSFIDFLGVEKGDYVYVASGTLHSISAGSLVYEIEENCNITYRLYDFNRTDENGKKRQLHINKALKAININNKSKTEKYNIGIEKQERFYTTKYIKNTKTYINNSELLECLTIIKGNSIIDGINIKRGTTIILEPKEEIIINSSDFIVSKPISHYV